MGRTLAASTPVEADLVIPTPESGTPAAIGYAQESGIPYGQGLVKNSYVGRTFIQPSQTIRQLGIRLKLNPLRDVIEGKRLVVVDDSIVRGNTQRALVRMLREAGAAEVHVRISSPAGAWPCFYGIDFATRAELIATGLGRGDLPLDRRRLAGLHLPGGDDRGHHQAPEALCRPASTAGYPVAVPELLDPHGLEHRRRARSEPTVDVEAGLPPGRRRGRRPRT
jgi:amidophosphoribosyltransferase